MFDLKTLGHRTKQFWSKMRDSATSCHQTIPCAQGFHFLREESIITENWTENQHESKVFPFLRCSLRANSTLTFSWRKNNLVNENAKQMLQTKNNYNVLRFQRAKRLICRTVTLFVLQLRCVVDFQKSTVTIRRKIGLIFFLKINQH